MSFCYHYYLVLLASVMTNLIVRPPPVVGGLAKHDGGSSILLRPTYDPANLYYYAYVKIGTHPFRFRLALTTSSPTTWVQSVHCQYCFNASDPARNFNPNASATFRELPGTAAICSRPVAVRTGYKKSSTCVYNVGFSQGILGTDNVSFSLFSSPSFFNIGKFAFGAGISNHISYGDSPIVGNLGLGKDHPSSILKQLSVQRFSYCLPAFSYQTSGTGTLDFGGGAVLTTINGGAEVQTTPIIKNPAGHRFEYFLNLTGITVNGTRLNISAGEGGVGRLPEFVIDTGAPLTVLSEHYYKPLRQAVVDYVVKFFGVKAVGKSRTGRDLCFDDGDLIALEYFSFPKIVFNFDGGAAVELENIQTFYDFGESLETCLIILPAVDKSGPSRFGALQQSGHKFLFDLEASKLSFVANAC